MEKNIEECFRPLQGLTIMNTAYEKFGSVGVDGFRPLQGLTIMNLNKHVLHFHILLFPSPTGVNHYESLPIKT